MRLILAVAAAVAAFLAGYACAAPRCGANHCCGPDR